MDYRLIDIPDNKLDVTINENIKESEKIFIVVSFIFVKGLMLILNNLRSFSKPENITIITSNYLKSTEPEALNKLLELKKLGANIYFFDSINSKENFHIKSYSFENEKKNFYRCIIGSSNIYPAFQQSHELNIEISNKLLFRDYKEKILNLLNSPFLYELNEKIIQEYANIYDEKEKLYKTLEEKSSAQLNVIKFEGPNEVQSEALVELKKQDKITTLKD